MKPPISGSNLVPSMVFASMSCHDAVIVLALMSYLTSYPEGVAFEW